MGPLFKNFTDTKQEHNRTSCTDIASEHRNTDCRCIKNRNFNPTLKQCMNTLIDIFDRFHTCDHCSDRHRQKQFVAIVNNNLCHKFIPIFAVGCSAGILSVYIRNINLLIMKTSQKSNDRCSVTCITDGRILCTFLNLGRSNHLLRIQIIL